MKAAIYTETGPADVLKIVDLPKPDPGEGELLVRIRASGVNPSDTKTRNGAFPFPDGWARIVPHNDGAGVVEAVGPGVPETRIGERIWLHTTQWGGSDGTAAEYAVARTDRAIRLPDSVSFEAGATFGVPLLTAWHAVTMNGPVEGKTVLVQGGAGAVGNYAIQIAKAKGARVIATVSSTAKADAARRAGADAVIDYRSEDLIERVAELTDSAGVDHLIEVNLSTNGSELANLMSPGGTVAIYGSEEIVAKIAAIPSIVKRITYGFFLVYELPQEVLERGANDLTKLLEADLIKPFIAETLPLDRIIEAHRAIDQADAIGNVVVVV